MQRKHEERKGDQDEDEERMTPSKRQKVEEEQSNEGSQNMNSQGD